jgi:ELWxxDGT repeat protein
VKDISPGTTPGSSSIHNVMEVGPQVFFSLNTLEGGTELYVSDGTAAGTALVRSFQVDTQIESMTAFDGALYFTASTGDHGEELWKSDGTAAGTVMLKDIYGGQESSSPSHLTVVGSELYFVAQDETHGRELWKSDGTSEGTELVADLAPGWDSSAPSNLTAMDGQLYFTAQNPATGRELWVSNGSVGDTTLVDDIRPGSDSSYPSSLTNVDGTLYFRASDGTSGYELWKSAGTPGSSELVKDIVAGPSSSYLESLTAHDGRLYFTTNDGTSGQELWTSDGTSAGTFLVKDIAPGSQSSYPQKLTSFDGRLFFLASDPVNGTQLWASDGTEAGTELVVVIPDGGVDSTVTPFVVVGSTLYFQAYDALHGSELWKTDGSQAGTALVKDIRVGVDGSHLAGPVRLNDSLYFVANDGINGFEPWTSDGTEAGTVLVADLTPPRGDSTRISSTVDVDGTLYFVADDDINGRSLWKTDGTEAGTELVSSAPDSMSGLFNAGGKLFFYGYDNDHGYELWTSDGTEAGTFMVRDITPGSQSTYFSELTSSGGVLFFRSNSPSTGYELWTSDGTEAGTVVVKDIVAGNTSSDPRELTDVDGVLYFTASDAEAGEELWKTDGTEAGTVRVIDLRPGPNSGSPRQLTSSGGKLYFVAQSDTDGDELWVSDGTAQGTVRVKDIRTDGYGSNPFQLTDIGGTLFFTADDGTHGHELWKSDGTEEGTMLVKDIVPGSDGLDVNSLVNVDGVLYFDNGDGNSDRPHELWKSDGTEEGTVLVAVIGPNGNYYGGIGEMVSFNGKLYFVGNDLIAGDELWASDGTAEGTVLVSDLEPRGSSYPSLLTVSGGKLFLVASTHATGEELFVLSPSSNASPTDISLTGSLIAESAPSGTVVGTLAAVDADADDSFTYELATGEGDDDNAAFTIVGDELRTAVPLNFETQSSYTVRIRTTDAAGESYERTFTITVSDVDEFDVSLVTDANAADNTIAENAVNGTAVGITAVAADEDGSNNTVTYSLTSDASGRFAIDSETGVVTVADASLLDFESTTSHEITVLATGNDGSTSSQSFTIQITDFDEFDVSAVSDSNVTANVVAENATNGAAVGITASATDPDGSNNTVTYSLDDDAGGRFAIHPVSGVVTVANGLLLDFETTTAHTIVVRATGSDGSSSTQSFVISVTNVPDGSEFQLSSTSILENSPKNSVIGTFSGADLGPGTVTYSLVSGEGSTDNGAFKITGQSLILKSVPNFEAKAEYSVRVQLRVGSVIVGQQTFTITVLNENEGPSNLALSVTRIAENNAVDAVVGDFTASDPDATPGLTYSLVDGTGSTDNAQFGIVGNQLTAQSAFDFEAKKKYSIRVRVTDGGGLTFERVFSISITNVNDRPTGITLSRNTIKETAPIGAKVGTLKSVDPDGSTPVFALVTGDGDTDNSSFVIEGSTLKLNAPLNFEAKTTYTIRVKVTDAGGLSHEETFVISVLDVAGK